MARYEINESVTEPKAVFGTDLSTVQAAVPKNGAPVVARNAGTSTSRALYATASGGSQLTQPILTVNGRIEAYVEGEAPVDLLINYGLSNQYTQRFTPPQVGAAGPPGGNGIALNMDDFPVIAPEADNSGQIQRALDAAATANRALFFLGTKTFQSFTIPSNTTLYGAGPWSVLKVSAAATDPYPIHIAHGVHDVHLHDFTVDGNKANITGDPDVTNNPQFAIFAEGTVADPCRRIFIDDVYQHDSKRLGIAFQNVERGRIRAVVENNDRDGCTLYVNCRDIELDLIVSGCGDDHLGINSGVGATVGLCERITGRLIAVGPSSRAKGRALTIRGGHTIRLDVFATDVSQSSVVLNNFSTANLTDFDIHLQSYRAGQGGGSGAEKHGVMVQVSDGGYIRNGRITGRITGALDQGVHFQNDKTTPASDDMSVDLDGLEIDAAVNDGIDMNAAGVDGCRVRARVHGCGGWGFSKTSVGRRIFVEEGSEFYNNANGVRARLIGDGSVRARVHDNTGVGVNVFGLFDDFDFAPKVWGNGTDYQDDGSHAAIWQGPYRVMTGSTTWDPASLADGVSATQTVTVPGVAQGDQVSVAFSSLTNTNWDLIGRATAADTVTAKLTNRTGGTVDVASGTLRAEARKYL